MDGTVERIYVTPAAGVAMQRLREVQAIDGCGLAGDRYCLRRGRWRGLGACQVTLIAGEDLDAIIAETGLRVGNGEHRRNLVTRHIQLPSLRSRHFRIGSVLLAYDHPRAPCAYLERLTETGMKSALAGRGGICANVLKGGWIHEGDPITLVDPLPSDL